MVTTWNTTSIGQRFSKPEKISMKFIVFDLEATCWTEDSPALRQEIIEIGACVVNRYGELLDRYQSFVKPVVHPFLSPFCKQLTTIEQSDVDSAKTYDRVYGNWMDWIGQFEDEPIYFCSWGDMDLKLIEADCYHHRIDLDWADSYFDVKKFYNQLKGKQGKPYGLTTALKREQIELEGTHHRALDDAYNLTKLFCRYIDEWGY